MKSNAIILALIDSIIDEKLSEVQTRGRPGKDGRSFKWDENENNIKDMLQGLVSESKDQYKLRFEDLTEEQKDSLRLKYSNLSNKQKDELKGKRGQKGEQGKRGKSLSFEDCKEEIQDELKDLFENNKKELSFKFEDFTKEELNSLKLKLSDLNKAELSSIQGERGKQGQKGEHGKRGLPGDGAYQTWLDNGNEGSEKDFLNSLKGADGKDGERGQRGEQGTQGPRGKSAYRIWLSEGNEGTEADFLASLKAKDGANGEDGQKGEQGIQGKQGRSAYRVWLSEGNEGTEEDFLNSIKGNDGKDGADGKDGVNGRDGSDGERGRDGSRGQRGKRGAGAYDTWLDVGGEGDEADFIESLTGKNGISGLPGLPGPFGPRGFTGRDGEDAPVIIDIDIEQSGNSFFFVFTFDDGSVLETDDINLPEAEKIVKSAVHTFVTEVFDVVKYECFEDIDDGSYVHIFDDSGTIKIRLASYSGPYEVHGFVKQDFAKGNIGIVFFEGGNKSAPTAVVGARAYLGLSGLPITSPIPDCDATGNFHQLLGTYVGPNHINTDIADYIEV